MNRRTRLHGAGMLIIAIVAGLVLAPALDNLQFGPGAAFPAASDGSAENQSDITARPVPAQATLPALRGILALSLLVLGSLLVKRLAEVTRLEHVLGLLLATAAIFLLLISLPRLPSGSAVELPPETVAPRVPSQDYVTSPLGKPPATFFWIAGLVVVTGAAVALIVALRPPPRAHEVSDRLAAEASLALEQMDAGVNAKSVIVRCYLQMTRLIQEERGVSRARSTTVREFEMDIRNLGLPTEPLLKLRSLFEAVRYGDREMSTGEEQTASDSLKAIVTFLKGGVA